MTDREATPPPARGSWRLAAARFVAGDLLRGIRSDVVRLAYAVQGLGCGAPTAAVPAPETPELEPLAAALEKARADLAASRAAQESELTAEVRKAWELEMAAGVQRSFLPRHFPKIRGAEVAATMHAASDVGGDFYDVIPLTGERVGLLVGDVAGKGFPAALYMGLARTLLRTHSLSGRPRYLSEAIESANVRQLMRSGSSGALAALGAVRQTNDYFVANHSADSMFFTLFYCVYEPASRRLVYVNAGHNAGLLYNARTGSRAWIRASDVAVGILADRAYEPQECRLEPGDRLVLYSDGVTEAFSSAREMFEEERLQEVVAAHGQESAGQIVAAIVEAVREHAGAEPQSDDITVLVLRIDDQGQVEARSHRASGRRDGESAEISQGNWLRR
jgi:phosphoserine phosphatase RsbU/P